jgi:long-chain acyl-CoA synthetase
MTIRSYPQGVPISIKYPENPVYCFLENNARKFPLRSATIFYGNKMTYEKMWNQVLRLANSFKKLGLKHGDRVGLLLPNTPQFLLAFNSILVAGGVAVPVNPLNPIEEICRELEDTECKILVVLDRLLNKIPADYAGILVIAEA